jgi:hypothetical protein
MKQKKEFRSFYQNIIELILAKKTEIDAFTKKALQKTKTKTKTNAKTKTKNKKSIRTKTRRNH